MKKIIGFVLSGIFILFLWYFVGLMIKTNKGIDVPLWLQFVFLFTFFVSALTSYKGQQLGFFSIFVTGEIVLLVSIFLHL
ncbi:TPA_asm: hypothetical protein GIN74_05565 [Listeria monocytogenes]|nr:hypothetical protein [Listeria monocytogenes]